MMRKNISTGAKESHLPCSFKHLIPRSRWAPHRANPKTCFSRSLGWIRLLAAATVAIAFCATRADAAVGRTPGTYSVTSYGAAAYTVPIFTPPGPNGLQPRISLNYNSQRGDGYLGVGWSLSGLSAIYRCNKTYAQDGAPAPVALTGADVFCKDGQRLLLTTGTYGQPNSTYQTVIADFSNTTAYGTAGNGPAYFTVQGRDGLTYEYGNTTDSRVLADGSTASSWMLDKVTDRAGNTMSYSYQPADANLKGMTVPKTIAWTPSSYGATSYNYAMQFTYQQVSLPSTAGYLAGTPVQSFYLLTNVQIQNSGATVKNYALSYQNSATTSRATLTQIKECADSAASNCLSPATTVTYQSGSAGISTTSVTLASNYFQLIGVDDLDGDGRDDLVYADSANNLWVSFGASGGFGTPISAGITLTNQHYGTTRPYPFTVTGDVHGSGRASILTVVSGTWWEYSWNSSSQSFTGSNTGLAVDTSTEAIAALVDVNGDGLLDLVTVRASSSGLSVYTRLNATSAGGALSFSSTRTLAYTNTSAACNVNSCGLTLYTRQSNKSRQIDFNGDGLGDLAIFGDYVSCLSQCRPSAIVEMVLLSAPNGTFSLAPATVTPGTIDWDSKFADINDDGCTDIAILSTVYYSGCNGSTPQQIALAGNALAVMDWDGDGRTDILVNNANTIGVYLSSGTGLSNLISTSVPVSGSSEYFATSPTGDGLNALTYWSSGGTIGYYLHNGAGQPPDLLASITDGYGNSIAPTYVSIAQTVNGVFFPWTDAPSGYQNYIGPLYVVNGVTYSDPTSTSGGTYSQSHFYSGAWLSIQGRGFSGFESHQTYDSRSGIWETQTYHLAFPYMGMLSVDIAAQDNLNNHPIFNRTQTVNYTVLPSQSYYPYVTNDALSNYEVGGSKNGLLIKTTNTSYTYDNYGNATNITTTVTDKDSGSPYYGQSWTTTTSNTPSPNTSTWCLSLFTQTQVAYTASNGSTAVTRTKQFTPDLTNCRYSEIITEPSSSLYKVTEDLSYDAFGNISVDKITGIGMAPRSTSLTWSNSTYTTGQFPLTITDASGATTQFGYDYTLGLLSSVTDPNGERTTWLYGDGFGRKTQETRPDGTYTQWTYYDCVNWGGCLVGAHSVAVAHYVYGVGGSLISDGTDYLDPLDRPLISNVMMLGGGSWNRNEVRYDSLGRKTQQAAPCIWTAVGTPCTYWTTTGYDLLNRPTQVRRPVNSSNGTLQTTTYQYAGDTTTVTDPQNHAKVFVTDPNGWLRQSEDAYSYTVVLGYDAAGSRTSVTDSLGNTLWSANGTYAYGIKPFLLGFTDMDRGSWGFTVDALGEQIGWTDAKGQQFSATYDALSRPLTRKEPDLFTQWTWGSSPALHNVGMLQSVCTGQGANPGDCTSSPGLWESRSYDSNARPYQRTITLPGGVYYTYTWQYNATTGLLDTLTYPVSTCGFSFKLQYGYSAGLLASITDVAHSPNVPLWQAGAQNPAGQLTQETINNGGIVVNRTFDAVTHWLASVQAGAGGGTGLLNLSFLYDEMGNLTERQDNSSLALTEDSYYDNDYRLLTTMLNGTQNLSITYDNTMGNITARSDVAGGATWTYSSTKKHAVTQAGNSSFVYSYDANGNMAVRQGQTIQWSSYNYPIAVSAGSGSQTEAISFAYGPDRNRWQQIYTGNGTSETTDYIGGLMDVVISGSTVDYRHYIYAGSEPIAVYSRKSSGTNAFSYFLTDHQLSVAKIVNGSSSTVTVSESFTPSGSRRNPSTWSGSPATADLTTAAGISRQGYTFQTQLGLWMGLNHMNGRVQDAVTGRFLSPDPFLPDDTNPQDYNRYSYASNNPLSNVDPTGFDDCFYLPGPPLASGPYNPDDTDLEDGMYVVPVDTNAGSFMCIPNLPSTTPPGPGGSPGGTPTTPDRAPRGGGPQRRPPPKPPGQQQIPCLPGVACLAPPQGGHDYRTQNLICHRPLTTAEQSDLISRFTVPNVYTQGTPKTPGTYLVANSWGLPGGWVTTTFSQDGLVGTNVTTPFHVFTGTVERTISNTDNGAIMLTHGYGGYSALPPPPPYAGSEAGSGYADIGGLLDLINNATGPSVFNAVDQSAQQYAMANFPGC